jgi:hypothetical protein
MVVLAKRYADMVPVLLDVSSLGMMVSAKLVCLYPIRQTGSHQKYGPNVFDNYAVTIQ